PPRRRPLRHQRLEDLHHERCAGRPRLSGREDGPEGDGLEGHLAGRRRNDRSPRLPGRPLARQGRYAGAGHLPALLRRRACAARVGRVFLDSCIERFLAGQLDDITAAMAKYWLTDSQCRIVDECLQLHGGYGYMTEYPIARMWTDSRVQRIYAGSNEIMKELI